MPFFLLLNDDLQLNYTCRNRERRRRGQTGARDALSRLEPQVSSFFLFFFLHLLLLFIDISTAATTTNTNTTPGRTGARDASSRLEPRSKLFHSLAFSFLFH
jgi:hypothetical protein